jgi:hypothetical protein
MHPSLFQVVLIEYLPVPAFSLGLAPTNPKDFKATFFWDLPAMAARIPGFKNRSVEVNSFVTCCRYRHIGTSKLQGLFSPNGGSVGMAR